MTDCPYAAARDYRLHSADHTSVVAGRNHAGQISLHCRCGRVFDVGFERFHTRVFQARPLCHDCTTKETQ